MKHQHQASPRDLEKRLRFLDEYKRIDDKAAGITDIINGGEGEGEGAEDQSPSSQFFLTK